MNKISTESLLYLKNWPYVYVFGNVLLFLQTESDKMGLVAEMPPAAERPQMSAGAPEMDFVAEADRIRRSQKHFMKVPGSLPPVGKMKHEKEAAISQVGNG
jgi:hypothetical protein